MSDDDRDIDIESDDENDSDTGTASSQRQSNSQNISQAEKRAHHNALERKRRDHIKESFSSLREAVPSLKGEKASRAQILKKTTECIQIMRRKIQDDRKDVEEIKKQNAILKEQIRMLQNAKEGYMIDPTEYQQLTQSEAPFVNNNHDSSDGDEPDINLRSKKMKTSYQA